MATASTSACFEVATCHNGGENCRGDVLLVATALTTLPVAMMLMANPMAMALTVPCIATTSMMLPMA